MSQGPLCPNLIKKSPKRSVPKGQSQFAMRYAIRWFKCKLKPPKGPLCPNLINKDQREVSQKANRNLPCAMLLGGLSVNLNHLKKWYSTFNCP